MKIIAIIPARLNSTRFPEKVLAKIGDRPMIQRVYDVGKSCEVFDEVVVATDSQRVMDCVQGFGGKAVMTSKEHKNGTERIAELTGKYSDCDIFVNLQGDQPFVKPEMLQLLVEPYLQGSLPEMATLACPLKDDTELDNPNTVKVLINQNQHAIYFSRSPIPYKRQAVENLPVFHHLGLYAFTRQFLKIYPKLLPTPLEQSELLEQLRVLENGYKIFVGITNTFVPEVNTPEDLLLAHQLNFI